MNKELTIENGSEVLVGDIWVYEDSTPSYKFAGGQPSKDAGWFTQAPVKEVIRGGKVYKVVPKKELDINSPLTKEEFNELLVGDTFYDRLGGMSLRTIVSIAYANFLRETSIHAKGYDTWAYSYTEQYAKDMYPTKETAERLKRYKTD
jgi:hypothetical protein